MTRKENLYNIIFESDTKAGKLFDVILLWTILSSVLLAMLDSVQSISHFFKAELYVLEWVLTVLFSIEYVVRIYISKKPVNYIFSMWGIVDLLAILPTYISLFFYGYQYLIVIRIVRLLRVFRVLKLVRFNKEAETLFHSLKASFYKIGIFLSTVVSLVILLGTIMYVVEGGQSGFSSIPQSIYWAVTTITTVGYGDIVPVTVLGKITATFIMLIGYAIIAVPTGIVTVEMTKSLNAKLLCKSCKELIPADSEYCNKCGKATEDPTGGEKSNKLL